MNAGPAPIATQIAKTVPDTFFCFDFDLKSTDYLGIFGLEILSDNDLAWFHLYGLMQFFEVEGTAKIKFDFDCTTGTSLNREEIVALMGIKGVRDRF